jgi:CheY-like chemotaxis protein
VNILWVKNHSQFARLAARRFLVGHSVTGVPSLAAARAALTGGTFEVVLIDFDLDDGKGPELIPWVKQNPRPPVIVATSAHEAGNRALVDAGADAICGKLEFAEIEGVLRRLVNPFGG